MSKNKEIDFHTHYELIGSSALSLEASKPIYIMILQERDPPFPLSIKKMFDVSPFLQPSQKNANLP